MRYSDETKKFWKLGYINFGGKFISFMSGFKNTDQVNFAVPNIDILRNYDLYVNTEETDISEPGIFENVIQNVATHLTGKACCVTFDRKKLKQGLTKTAGDVDLLGFESDVSLAGKQSIHLKRIEQIIEILEELQRSDINDIMAMSDSQKDKLKSLCADALTEISLLILKARSIKKKKCYARDKLMERNGDHTNWKNGKYAYAISDCIAYVHDIDQYMEKSISVINELIKFLGFIQGDSVIDEKTLNLDTCLEYSQINENLEIKSTRDIKQRTERWFAARKEATITGSTLYRAIGFDGLKAQKTHFDTVVCGLAEPKKSDTAEENMAYGTENEINAIATLVGEVKPVLYPKSSVYEEGYIELKCNNDTNMKTIISPDGSIRSKADNKTIAGIEVKCPVAEIHTTLPSRFLLQCLAKIESLDVDKLVYLRWRPDISTVFIVKRNHELFMKAYEASNSIYMESTDPRDQPN